MSVLNYPGPCQIRMFYTTTPTSFPALQHQARYNVANFPAGAPTPGLAFNLIQVTQRNGTQVGLNTWMDAWVTVFRALMSNVAGNTVDFAELWYYDPGTFNASFVSTYNIALAGTTAAAATGAAEQIMTFRSQQGGSMRLHFEEMAASSGGAPATAPFPVATAEAIRALVVGVTNCWLAADTSYPFASVALYPGQNEAIFKKRFRP